MPEKPDLPEEESELYEHFRLIVDKGQSLLRIDKFLMLRIENASRNKIQNAAHAGNILVNDQPVKPNYRVKPLDVISVLLTHPPRDTEIIPEDIPLDIVYEDPDILIVNKAAGMVVHPAYGNFTGTLVNALAWHFIGKSVPGEDGPIPALVHRIDKDTSGILVVAKHELAQSRLAMDFFNHHIDRVYQALVWGEPRQKEGTITGNLARDPRNRLIMKVFPDNETGKNAVTHYRVIESFGYVSLLECRLETGRTHQIRAHLKFLGHPLFNDEKYGGNEILRGTTFSKYKQFVKNCFEMLPRQALHAKSLGFRHPMTGGYMNFDSELPADMAGVIEKWRNYSSFKGLTGL